jgi:hypothetical protein
MDFMSKHPEDLEYMSKHPEAFNAMSNKPEALEYMSEHPEKLLLIRLSRIFTRSDLFDQNLPLVKAAVLGGIFELIHVDHDNWEKSTLKPQKGLEWAKKLADHETTPLSQKLADAMATLVRLPESQQGRAKPKG